MRELKGRAALLTGASSGLGPIIARRLHAEGVQFILSARREAELQRLAAELPGSRVIVADLARRGEAERLAAEAGRVDILISNAGVPVSGRLVDLEVPNIDRGLDVNLRAAIVLTRLLLPGMLERQAGHVVVMASLAGQIPGPRNSVYNATKFGLRGFGHALRTELRGTGVSASVVSPSFVSEAGMWADSGQHSPFEVPPGRVADAVLHAIQQDKAEITVAPVMGRIGGRFALIAPSTFLRVAGRTAGIPPEAVEGQRSKS
ncbi:MAG TPA: SDR family NAD(P)-dependent oxidoreductase [Candidatus Dormibacteraeota bacterium]|nr:SDR family NAD(P)-dependent oxidoreductase [Candidatus Dormibacteraeota bacterium]